MRNLLFTFTLLFTLVGNLAFAQSINDADRHLIERELERQISSDQSETVRVRVTAAESYSISNRETGVRGQASLEGQRSMRPGRNDIRYDVVIDTRRAQITSANWSYGRNPGGENDRDRNSNTGVLRSGRYENQVISTRRLLVADNNGQVVQTNSGNARRRQWTSKRLAMVITTFAPPTRAT